MLNRTAPNSDSSFWTEAHTAQTLQIWTDYQLTHDISAKIGQTVGIDPVSSEIWFGTSAQDIWRQRKAQGVESPFYCIRVGSDYYVRKGGRR